MKQEEEGNGKLDREFRFSFRDDAACRKTEKNFPSFNKKELSEIEFSQKPLKLYAHKKIITNF